MDDSLRTGEVVSDLMDGRLKGQAFSDAVRTVVLTAPAREVWHTYHLVGDVLRSGDLAPHADDAGFLSRFQERLQEEVAVQPIAAHSTPLTGSQESISAPDSLGARAANDGRFSWKWVAGLAVVAAVSWSMLGDTPGWSSAQLWVQAERAAPGPVLVETSDEAQVMIRDPRLDRLLMAHRQSGGASALQVPSGFLRNATFEVSSRQGLQN